MKIAVIGVGGTGSAALRFLARQGHHAVGFEQFRIGHAQGSSHGESRIIRYTYPDLLYTQMMGDAYPLWAELEEQAGEELFVRCGGVLFGPRDHERVRDTRAALAGAGLPYELLEPGDAHRRFPALRLRPDEIALWQESSGFLRSSRCVAANARLAQQHGATLRQDTPVLDVASRDGRVVVQTEDGEELFDRAIVTSGAWMGKLLARVKLPLQVEQRQVVYLKPHDPTLFEPSRLPIWIDAGASYYGFPSDGRVPGVKLASHVNGFAFDPGNPERPLSEENLQEAIGYAAERFPDLSDEVVHAQACLYTLTPDEHFILDRAPDMENVWLVSGCSGHGFKFTVLLGRIAASLATGGTYERDLGRFSLHRFQN